jgi:hypothetical protein
VSLDILPKEILHREANWSGPPQMREPAIASPKAPAPSITTTDFQSALNEKEPEPLKTVKRRAAAIFIIFVTTKNLFIFFNSLPIWKRHPSAKLLKLI